LRVLVIDDNADVAESLAMMLSLSGHDVRTAGMPTMAVDIACEHKPDVVFLDIEMPGLSGYQLAERLLQMEDLRDTVLVAAKTGQRSSELEPDSPITW
jgi:CheY-like chemotaxis protein